MVAAAGVALPEDLLGAQGWAGHVACLVSTSFLYGSI